MHLMSHSILTAVKPLLPQTVTVCTPHSLFCSTNCDSLYTTFTSLFYKLWQIVHHIHCSVLQTVTDCTQHSNSYPITTLTYYINCPPPQLAAISATSWQLFTCCCSTTCTSSFPCVMTGAHSSLEGSSALTPAIWLLGVEQMISVGDWLFSGHS